MVPDIFPSVRNAVLEPGRIVFVYQQMRDTGKEEALHPTAGSGGYASATRKLAAFA